MTSAIHSAAKRLAQRFSSVDPQQIGISDDGARYLTEKLRWFDDGLTIYTRLLTLACAGRPLGELTIVDYGGGIGVLSMLAKESGVGRVIYNDIIECRREDAEAIAREVGVGPDDFHCGDADDLVRFLNEQAVHVDAVVAYDVFEHIYSIDDHYRSLRALNDGKAPSRIIHGSGANIYSRSYVDWVTPIQVEAECSDSDGKESFRNIRAGIIRAYANSHSLEISPEKVDELSIATRGMNSEDVEGCVEAAATTGALPEPPGHPTNTCHPHTGSWCERLMEHDAVAATIEAEGYSVSIGPGRHTIAPGSGFRHWLKLTLMNTAIRTLGRRGMYLAPHYIVIAHPRGVA